MEGNISDPLKFGSGLLADRPRQRSTENFFNDADGHRLQAIAPRDGAAIASKEAVELNSKVSVRDERNKKQESLK